MKFKAHQSFFIRKGWLSKGMRAVASEPAIFMPSNSREAMDELGLGSNQVVALRYWLGAVGLIEKTRDGKSHETTGLCELILGKDPYVEEMGTVWALHYNLACNRSEATSWYWLFNELKAKTFSKIDLARGIENYALLQEKAGNPSATKGKALSSIESDVDCILNTYIPHARLGGKQVSPENVIDCPFGELGIMDIENRIQRVFRKRTPAPSALPSELVLYATMGMIERRRQEDCPAWCEGVEIPIEELLSGVFSPGLAFNLDSVSLLGKLYDLESGGSLKINRTAGSDVIRLANPDEHSLSCLAAYYKKIG